jgi:hypothetical protein
MGSSAERDSSNDQVPLNDHSGIELQSSWGVAPIEGTRPEIPDNITSNTLTLDFDLGVPISLPVGYDPVVLSNMPLPSEYKKEEEEKEEKEKEEEGFSNELKEAETKSADIEGATLDEVTISETCSLSERRESSFEGTTLRDTDELSAAGVEQQAILDSTKGTEDYMSLASNDEDIASQTTRRRTEQEILAVKLFSIFFAESEELSRLHKNALEKLGPSRFLENYRRILKAYVLKLRVEARTALEKDTVKVIESRGNRRSIAKQIMTFIASEGQEGVKPLGELAKLPLMKQNLEDWAKTAYGLPDTTQDNAPEQAEHFSEGSDEDADAEEGSDNDYENQDNEHMKTLTFTTIEKACHFLHQNIPFQTLILQLRLLVLPTSLREIIETTPKQSIRILADSDMSPINRLKNMIEAFTATQWDWWPLAPKVPDLAPDRLLLEWQVSRRSPGTYYILTR